MNTELKQIIKYDSEGPTLDYKKVEYPLGKHIKKNEFLKDISAFANHHSDSNKYIIIGVKEENGIANEFLEIENITDVASYQQFLNENIEPEINFEYKTATYEGKKIAYFRIYDNKKRPYLFKKTLQNPFTKETEYKIGDGFIRVGSLARKIDRKDLESIYKTRFSSIDRKRDLDVEVYFGTTNSVEIVDFDMIYLDIKITNQSNRSIEFDVEMKVFKNENYTLLSEDQFIKVVERSRKKESSVFGTDFSIFQPQIKNMYVDYQEHEDYIIISRNSIGGKSAIKLAQNSSESDIFSKHVFVLEDDVSEIKAELTIRSDDFTEGALIKELIFIRERKSKC